MKMYKIFIFSLFVQILYHANASAPKIVNGKPAVLGQFPYMASIDCIGCGIDRELAICGGAILDNRWILTEGFCVDYYQPFGKISARVGHINVTQGTQYNISVMVLHPNYTDGYDLALLRTSDDIVFGPNVRPITIDSAPLTFDDNVVISGFGHDANTYLQYALALTIDRDDCLAQQGDVNIWEVCTISTPDTGACSYDDGSPIVKDGKLVGVQTRHKNGCGTTFDVQMGLSDNAIVEWINAVV